jgi:hypothetical protein
MKFLFVNSKENYASKIKMVMDSCSSSGLQVDLWSDENKDGVVHRAITEGYSALIHRNEHGRLFADSSLPWIKLAIQAGIPVLSTDFGYLDHYKTCMFDFYRRTDLSSGIHDEWASLPDKVDWLKAPKYIRQFRSHCLEKIATADGSRYFGKVGVWMQWNTKLLRPELGVMQQHEWLNLVCAKIRQIGLEPVVKMGIVNHSEIYKQTIPHVDPGIQLVSDKPKVSGSNERAFYDKNANWNMLAGCQYHVIICSSVSHLMVLTGRPVIATGQSWFNALNVFQEPVEWHSPLVKPVVDKRARSKWINWWLSRQSQWGGAAEKLINTYHAAKKHFDHTA